MLRLLAGVIVAALFVISALAQNDPKPRVFITDSKSWEISGGAGGADGAFGGHTSGGARPQTAEIIKTFSERCPDVIVNNKQEKANYVVLLDHEGGKGIARKDNKVAVFNSDGDSIVSHSTRSLGNAVKDACDAIVKDWPRMAGKAAIPAASPQPAASGTPAEAPASNRISVSSMPANADIEVDGSFVGNTPSIVEVTPGEHVIAVKKAGYKNWERKMKVTGGAVNIAAELEKMQ